VSDRRRRAIDTVAVWAMTRVQKWLRGKPVEKQERIGARIGRLIHDWARKRRERALANLELAMPELSQERRAEVASQAFEHFGIVSADFLTSDWRTLEDLERSTEVVGYENVESALAKGKGALLLSGHFGNWERASAYLSLRGVPLSVVVRDANTRGVNQLVNDLRRGTGAEVISRGAATRGILETLRRNGLVALLPDQNAEDAFLPFFGKPAGTNLGAGVIQARTGTALVPTTCVRVSPGRYRITVYPELEPKADDGIKGSGALLAFNEWLEERIREHPEQWLWFHDRWRNARQEGLL
jgi:Kdo2-lipid IVA lauroyltransferase/acyltransferase